LTVVSLTISSASISALESPPVALRGDDAARRLDAVELGYADVHQHDVGLPRHVDGLDVVVGLADHLDVVLGADTTPAWIRSSHAARPGCKRSA
jgi:hypothetical protein